MPSARPDYLEDFLVSLIREFRGAYAPDSEWVKSTVDYFEDDLRRYLGTYFPRSFLETYEIAVELFGKVFGSGVSTDGELKLLDIGCGMGGASLGLLFAVLERFAVKKVVLDGFDAIRLSSSRRFFDRPPMQRHARLCARTTCPGRAPRSRCISRRGRFPERNFLSCRPIRRTT